MQATRRSCPAFLCREEKLPTIYLLFRQRLWQQGRKPRQDSSGPPPRLSWGDRRRATIPQGPVLRPLSRTQPSRSGAVAPGIILLSSCRSSCKLRHFVWLPAAKAQRGASSFLSGFSQDGCVWPLDSRVRPSGPSSGPEGSCPFQAAPPLPEFRALGCSGRRLLTPASVLLHLQPPKVRAAFWPQSGRVQDVLSC